MSTAKPTDPCELCGSPIYGVHELVSPRVCLICRMSAEEASNVVVTDATGAQDSTVSGELAHLLPHPAFSQSRQVWR